jgi:adenylate cyclase
LGSAALATGRVERRLAAILAADVAGYSRLVGADALKQVSSMRQ